MPADLDLALRIRADVRRAIAGLRQVDARIDQLGPAARGARGGLAGMNRELERTERRSRSLSGSLRGLRGGIAALGIGFSAVTAVRMARDTVDAYTDLNNRLRLVTDSEDELVDTRQRLLDLSRETRTELGANAIVYSRLSLAAKDLGRSDEVLLRVVETLNKQVAIGGSNAIEARQGLIQLSQGIASNRLQGDELRSVLESLLGVSNGLIVGFRRLREEGQISFDVTRANIRELAAEGKLTAELLIDAILASADDTERKFRDVNASIASSGVVLANSLGQAFGQLDEAAGFSRDIGAAMREWAESIDDVDEDKLTRMGEQIRELAEDIATFFVGGGVPALFVQSLKDSESEFRAFQRRRLGAFDPQDLPELETPDIGEYIERIEEAERRRADTAEKGFQAALEAESKFHDEQDRLLDERRERQILAAQGYDSERERDRAQHLQRLAAIEDARDRPARTIEDRQTRELEAQLTEQEQAYATFYRNVAQIRDQVQDPARVAQLIANEQQILDAALADSVARQDEAREDLLRSIADAERDLLDSYERQVAEIDRWEAETIAALRAVGAEEEALARITEVAAVLRRNAREAQTRDLEREAEAERRRARDARTGAQRALGDIAEFTTDAASNVEQAIGGSFRHMEEALEELRATGKLAVSDLVDHILAEFHRIAVRQLILGPLAQALANLLGGGGGLQTGLPLGDGSSFAGFAHGGGIAGALRSGRRVPALAFLGARRLHQGGVAGLRDDEVPTVLRRGEGVFTPEQMAALGPGVMQVDVRLTNVGGQPVEVRESSAQVDGQRLVVAAVIDDVNSGGALDRAIQGRYGLRPQAL